MRKLILLFLGLVIAATTYAIPADSTPRTLKLKDGRMLTISLQGDEYLSWAKTIDGYTLLQTDNGEWMYAQVDTEGNLVASNCAAADPSYRTSDDKLKLAKISKDLGFSKSQLNKANQQKSANVSTKASFPLSGSPKLLVILVDFNDRPFTTSHSYWDTIASVTGATAGGATGSMRDYYYYNSMGAMDLDVTVLGPCRMPQNLSFYGANQSGSDGNVRRLVQHAIAYVDTAYNVDFTQYDNDNNDTLDNVHIIFAGIPESTSGESNSIWPHKSILYNFRVEADGVRVHTYSCSGEKKSAGMADGIGAMCHEFGHVLGLPDMYDTDGNTGDGEGVGLGDFSLMHGGCYNNDSRTPPSLAAVEREILGWHTHTTLTEPVVVKMGNLGDSNVSYKITTYNQGEYYILENRQKSGWDAYNPAGGMLIYHVDKNVSGWDLGGYNSNMLNCNPYHQGCYIVSANGDSSNYNLLTAYPTQANNKFSARTSPASWTWYNSEVNYVNRSMINKPVSHITIVDSTFIQFNYMLLDTFPLINILSSTDLTSTSVVISASIVDTQRVNVTSRGICWSTSPEPTLENGYYIADSLIGEGAYSLRIEGLQRGTRYYARAYAINSYCTTYSSATIEFTTLTGAPRVTTRTVNDIEAYSAMLRGRIDDTVDATVTRFGFMVSTNQAFDTVNEPLMIYEVDSLSNSNFSFLLDSLSEYTRYYVRAFAENSYGVGLGNIVNFTTTFERIENNIISENQVYCGLENRQPLAVDDLTGSEPTGRTAPYTYLWQYKTLSTGWADAPNVNNTVNYIPGTLSDSTYYRRIVSSTGIYDTSNTILVAISYSRGGNVTYNSDTVKVNERIGRLRVQNNKGDIVQWERKHEDGEWVIIAGASNTIYDTLKVAGNYYYRVKVQFGDCLPTYSAEKRIYAKDNVGINTADKVVNVAFTPNPSTGVFEIVASTDETFEVKVLTMDGKVCYSEDNVRISGKRMDLSNMPNGAYIVVISNETTQMSNKIIINK